MNQALSHTGVFCIWAKNSHHGRVLGRNVNHTFPSFNVLIIFLDNYPKMNKTYALTKLIDDLKNNMINMNRNYLVSQNIAFIKYGSILVMNKTFFNVQQMWYYF